MLAKSNAVIVEQFHRRILAAAWAQLPGDDFEVCRAGDLWSVYDNTSHVEWYVRFNGDGQESGFRFEKIEDE